MDRATIEVEPSWLDFGEVGGGDVEVRTLGVRNQGGSALTLEVPTLDGDDGFAVLETEGPWSLGPGEGLELSVRWLPMGAAAQGSLWLFSDDLDAPEVEIPLFGLSSVAELQLEPDRIDLGGVDAGCAPEREVVLRNVGRTELDLHGVRIVGDDGFSLSGEEELPTVLGPGEEASLWLSLLASHPGPLTAALEVSSSEPRGLREAPASAVVVEGEAHLESFVQEEHEARLDLLLAVDGSDSMAEELSALAEALPQLATTLDDAGVDWQLAVVSSDTGCVTPPMVGAGETLDEEAIARMLGGESGYWSESLLTLASLAVADGVTGPDDCNAGLLREDTPLWVLAVSDEPDQSYSTYATYLSRLQAAADGPVVFSAIAGDVPEGCESARPGTGYWEASLVTDGAFVSICAEDWAAELAALGDGAVNAARFDALELSETPWVTSLEVRVEGERVWDWAFDEVQNAVVFDLSAVPEPGEQVEVSYLAASDCGD